MIRSAGIEEAGSITELINHAFRVEKFFVESDRISFDEVRRRFNTGIFLVLDGEGVVYVELRGERAYFGLLSVDPARQANGTGKRLIAAAEEYARAHDCGFMDITVVNLRTELPPFYRRLGYEEYGTMPFPRDEETKVPAHLICMSKRL